MSAINVALGNVERLAYPFSKGYHTQVRVARAAMQPMMRCTTTSMTRQACTPESKHASAETMPSIRLAVIEWRTRSSQLDFRETDRLTRTGCVCVCGWVRDCVCVRPLLSVCGEPVTALTC